MAYSIKVKDRAILLRNKGYSIKEVAKVLGIAQSTSSVWLRNVSLNSKARIRLKQRHIYGQYKSMETWKRKRKKREKYIKKKASLYINNLKLNKEVNKLLCALLFWCEGGKEDQRVTFANSDPKMVATFLILFRSSFLVKKEKFRALIHVHEYHNETKIKQFWSNITKIPLSQFNRSYKKPHTKKRKRPGYKGCIRITYYDTYVARELHSIYNMFAENLGA